MATEVLDNVPLALKNIVSIRELSRDMRKGCLKVVLELNPDILTTHGEIPGGYISMMAIAVAEALATTSIEGGRALLVVNHDINFLKHPEIPGDIEIESCVLNRGERILNISSYVRCEETDVVYALSTFIVESD